MGVLVARGEMVLFADADGATDFRDLPKLEKELAEIAVGDDSSGAASATDASARDDAGAARRRKGAGAPDAKGGDLSSRVGVVAGSRAHLEVRACIPTSRPQCPVVATRPDLVASNSLAYPPFRSSAVPHAHWSACATRMTRWRRARCCETCSCGAFTH